MAATIWKGVLRVGEESLPIKFRSAVSDRSVHFRLLHEPDGVPVEQRMVHPGTEEVVPYDQIERGYETDEGTIVVLDDEELEELEPAASRDIEILRVVPESAVDHRWYLRPYWLAPDDSAKEYFALARALEEKGVEAIVRWTMRKKEYQGALRARDGYLLLVTLRHADEVVSAAELEGPAGRKLEPRERKMAEQLVDALAGEFEPGSYTDEYRNRVMELIEAKASGKTIELEPVRRKRRPESLAAALEQSLKRARREKSVA